MSGFTEESVPDASGLTAMVTGANTGIGFHVTRVLAARGARVLLGCRSQDKANAAIAEIREATPDADLTFVPLDQGNLDSIAAAAELVADEPALNLLINNAGIMMPPLQYTDDGFESQFGVNHLGTFALTAQLLDKLGESPDGRVVMTSSIAHKGGSINFDDLAAEGSYRAQERYQQSKLANLLCMYELDRRLQAADSTTISVAAHPGVAVTELGRHMPGIVRVMSPLFKPLLNSPSAAAWPTLMAATAPDVNGGDFFGPAKRGETAGPAQIAPSTKLARDPEVAARLWETSIEMTGVDPGI